MHELLEKLYVGLSDLHTECLVNRDDAYVDHLHRLLWEIKEYCAENPAVIEFELDLQDDLS